MGEPEPAAAGVDHLVDYLKRMGTHNPAFFYTFSDNNNNIFWVDPSFRMSYNYFGDTVRLHIAPPHYSLPLVTITGINHHAQPLLFGCGLLHSLSTESYVWLLQNWLHAMSGNYPVSITTQPDHHIQMAVQQVFPHTRHRFCMWAIFRQTIEKLPQTPQSFHNEFRKCIHDTDTVNEFESCWQTLLHRYFLMDNEWLHSIYNARHQWVPAFMKQTFFGQLLFPQQEQEVEDMFFFNGYVNSTTSIESLVKQYECALTSWQEMELKADFETATTTPVLKTPSPMENQAANLYTRRAFLKFQEELVETLAHQATKLNEEEEEDSCVTTTYRVTKFGDDEQQEKKKKAHIVRFYSLEMKAICSCHMFEFSGIICRHALSVFRAQNVLTLPSQYILKRWTRDAKRGRGGEEYVPELLLTSSNNNSQDSLTVRYNNLRHEALKFVEEGAKSVHIYNTALDALQVAANKVDASKKRVNSHTVILNGGNQETAVDKGSQQTSYQSKDEKEKKIRKLTTELHNTNQQCEVYRANLLAVLRDMEEQKLKLSVKVQNARLSLKE